MALYIQNTSDVKFATNEKSKRLNDTLENVAEEMLNGMFCHYEPPDPRKTEKYKRRGILRGGTRSVKKKSKANYQFRKSVSWSDAVFDDATPPVEIRCSLSNHCVDATKEAGCVAKADRDRIPSSMTRDYDYEISDHYSQGNLPLPRLNKHLQSMKNVVFDDEGFLREQSSAASTVSVPPPPPPPPSIKEKFIPQLCGVRINCCDDDEQMEQLAKATDYGRKPIRVLNNNYSDDDDDENSIIDSDSEVNEEAPASFDESVSDIPTKRDIYAVAEEVRKESAKKKIQKERYSPNRAHLDHKKLREHDKKAGKVKRRGKSKKEPDWEGTSNVSSIFHRIMPSRSKSKSPSRSVKSPKASPVRQTAASLDPIEMVRVDRQPSRASPRVVVSNSMRRVVSPRSKSSSWESDWDESVPIIRVAPPEPEEEVHAKSRWSLPGRGRDKAKRDASPGPARRARSRSADSRDGRRKSFNPASMLRMKSKGRSKSPGKLKSRTREKEDKIRVRKLSDSFDDVENFEKKSYITSHRDNVEESIQMGRHQPRAITNRNEIETHSHGGNNARNHSDGQLNSRLHPAHPLINHNHTPPSTDTFDKQSYVTAHRESFADVTLHDEEDRNSLISAHREGFEKLSQPPPPHPESEAKHDQQQQQQQQQIQSQPNSAVFVGNKTNSSVISDIPPIQRFYQSLGFQTATVANKPSSPLAETLVTSKTLDETESNAVVTVTSSSNDSDDSSAKEQIALIPEHLQQNYRQRKTIEEQLTDIQNGGHTVKVIDEDGKVATARKEELTWEEKTRMAWEKLRGGVNGFMGDSVDGDPVTTPADTQESTATPPNSANVDTATNINNVSMNDNEQAFIRSTVKPVGILRTPSSERRVRFGQDSERIFEKDVDENEEPVVADTDNLVVNAPDTEERQEKSADAPLTKLKSKPTKPSSNNRESNRSANKKEPPPSTPNFSMPLQPSAKVDNKKQQLLVPNPAAKKKVLRGTKFINGIFGKNKPTIKKNEKVKHSDTSVASSGSKNGTVDSYEQISQHQHQHHLYQQQMWHYYQQQQQQQQHNPHQQPDLQGPPPAFPGLSPPELNHRAAPSTYGISHASSEAPVHPSYLSLPPYAYPYYPPHPQMLSSGSSVYSGGPPPTLPSFSPPPYSLPQQHQQPSPRTDAYPRSPLIYQQQPAGYPYYPPQPAYAPMPSNDSKSSDDTESTKSDAISKMCLI